MSEKRPHRAVQLPSSHRTLQQPSQMPLYMAAGRAPSRPGLSPALTPTCYRDSSSPPPPSHTEPTPWGETIPNTASHLGSALRNFQLNLPSPLTCTSPAPPTRADPFRRGPHAFRVLGGPTWVRSNDDVPTQMVLQLSAQEDRAVTCLLALGYQDPNDSQVGEGTPDVAAAPPQFRRLDDVEHYDEFLLPIPPP
ncbi:uncharacterized protein LOC144004199 [Festucalex cinctus]